MTKSVKLIVACDLNGMIAYNGKIPWSEKKDQLRFKNLTTGHSVIMGRLTYDSLPPSKLPNRKKFVISSNSQPTTEDTSWHSSLEQAIEAANLEANRDIWIIGGEQVYAEALNKCIPDFIDETILDYAWAGEIGEVAEIKRLPLIPRYYEVVSEHRNPEALHLRHRMYKRASGRLYLEKDSEEQAVKQCN
jgi:dihydrofolate reductase